LLDKAGAIVVNTTIMSSVSPKSEDPRSRKTRVGLQNAFMELVPEHDFESVSIAMIAQRADKNRATFYKYYEDKYELLRDCMLGWLEEYIEGLEVAPPSEMEKDLPLFVADIERHYMEHRRFYVAILENGRFPAFHALFTKTLERRILQWIEMMRGATRLAAAPSSDVDAKRLAVFITYACFGALLDWLNNGDERDTESHARMLASLVLPLVHF